MGPRGSLGSYLYSLSPCDASYDTSLSVWHTHIIFCWFISTLVFILFCVTLLYLHSPTLNSDDASAVLSLSGRDTPFLYQGHSLPISCYAIFISCICICISCIFISLFVFLATYAILISSICISCDTSLPLSDRLPTYLLLCNHCCNTHTRRHNPPHRQKTMCWYQNVWVLPKYLCFETVNLLYKEEPSKFCNVLLDYPLPLVDFTELFKVHLLSFSMVSCQTISNTISNRTNKLYLYFLYLYLYFLNLYLYFLNFTELLVHLLREKLATYLQHHLQPDQQISVKVLFLLSSSILVNPRQSSSILVKPCQSSSILVNPCQSFSILLNPCQTCAWETFQEISPEGLLWLTKKGKVMPMLDQREVVKVDTIHRGLIITCTRTNMCKYKIT